MKVESFDKTVQDLLHESYYRIPRYQRHYAWKKSHNEEFWEDTITESCGDYFIGSMIVFEATKDSVDIVDGQQRLTTITLLLVALRDAFAAEGHEDLAQGLHRFIERRDVNNKLRYVLMTQSSSPYLQEHIQKREQADTPEANPSPEEKDLATAFEFFSEELDSVIGAIRSDPSLSEKKQKDAIRSRLIEVRDKVLGLQVILVRVDNEDDAYIIFETLNSRGMDLTVSDLLKNYLLRGLKNKNADVDIHRDKFNSIHVLFQESERPIDVNRFIHHSWLTRDQYVSLKKLFPRIKRATKSVNDKKELLGKLVEDSKLYRAIHEPESYDWNDHDAELVPSLQALDDFRVTQPLPFVLAVLRARILIGSISLKQSKRALRAVECFHFMNTSIAQHSSSGGISQMYASHARGLLEASTSQARDMSLKTIGDKLRDRLPNRDEFIEEFVNLRFSQEHTTQKKLIQYVLRSHYAKHASGGKPDFNSMTIEHLAPQKPRGGRPMQGFERIGNLILVDQATNDKLGNRSFAKKRPVLQAAAKGQLWVEPWILAQSTWSKEKIDERGRRLAEEAYEEIWRF